MGPYIFEDALSGGSVSCEYPGLEALMVRGGGVPGTCRSLFFPGCSFINYALPLVQSVYDLLREAGRVDGISLLCCGKILSYEPDGKALRTSFEAQLREHVAAAGVERIVAACPNCVKALRDALAHDERTASVQVVALPAELAELGYRIDAGTARRMLSDELARLGMAGGNAGTEGAPDAEDSSAPETRPLLFMPQDSCPDRKTGEFADGLRALLPPELVVEGEHVRKNSVCCGSLARAAGKFELAEKQAHGHGDEASDLGASGIATACVSCSYLLSALQRQVPVFHYLELLYDWRIDWYTADAYMKLRFLFDESLGVVEAAGGERPFVGLGGEGDVVDPRGTGSAPAAGDDDGTSCACQGASGEVA